VKTSGRARQSRRLIRARTLQGFRDALTALASDGRPLDALGRAFVLPTHASIEMLRQTLERAAAREGRAAIVPPLLLTRDDWLASLHGALPDAPPRLGRVDREVLLEAAAHAALGRRWVSPPFDIRPGLVAEMLKLYDALRRRQRDVRRFVRVLFDELRVERGTDRGSESLIHQTCFLGFAFLGYERRAAASGAIDEHMLRGRLLAADVALPFDHLVVAVADEAGDPRGLWPADFDLIGRLGRLRLVDIVVTDEIHDAGFRDRIERELPGIEEVRAPEVERPARPILVVPADAGDRRYVVHRDREEELRDVARTVRRQASATNHELRDRVGVVFQRPLPYLYLAEQVLDDGRVPFDTFDALPLAGEPYAALLDLVLTVGRTGGTREAMVALLRSPLASFRAGDEPVTLKDVAALETVLAERRAIGEADSYVDEVTSYAAGRRHRRGADVDRATRAARAAAVAHDALQEFRRGITTSVQLGAVIGVLRQIERLPAPASGADASRIDRRFLRGRAAVLDLLRQLRDAYRTSDDHARSADALTAVILHHVEAHTFSPARGGGGIRLVDAVAARFAEFDHVHIVGLVEADWPEPTRPNIFYTPGLLKSLGWPQHADHIRVQQAAFRDLVRLPAKTLTLHSFQLDNEAIVAVSPLVESARDLAAEVVEVDDTRPVFADEVLTIDPPVEAGLSPESAAWLRLRLARPALPAREYAGFVGPQPARPYRVSRVDHYIDCPFKYFAENVLGLPEDREEEAGLTPLERGTLVHELFERFYRRWQEQGNGSVTVERLPKALELFAEITREALQRYPEADRSLETTRLLGSIVARGIAERVFELEASAEGEVVDRLIECDLRGPFSFPLLNGLRQRTVEISGKADRVDIFADGGLRVVDYKLSRLPDTDVSIQVAVYAHAVRQWLERRDGRPHPIAEAMYVAFGDDRRPDARLGTRNEPASMAVEARASDFAAAVEQIEAGAFPARPRQASDCAWCRYAGVCRKEYFVETAEPV
jgi:RecB family exonuclease